jgi:type I restriction enzyme S subunit
MKTKSVPYSWIQRWGLRLDTSPYMGGAVEARVILEKIRFKKERLKDLTAGHKGGIYNGPMFRRNYVLSAEHGVPFLTSGSMLRADLSALPYLRREDAESNKLSYLRLTAGTTMISCSGTIGRMIYARPDMENMWASQDILKVVPNKSLIPSGYLHAFLTSKFGVPLITSGTYGAIIQHIESEHISELPVPRLGSLFEQKVHQLVEKAAGLRAVAAAAMNSTVTDLPRKLGLQPLCVGDVTRFSTSQIRFSDIGMRLDAPYHSAAALEVERQLDECGYPVKFVPDVVQSYFKPPLFKRLWVDSAEHGRQFVSGTDAYRYSAEEQRFVSNRTPNFEQFILKKGWVIFQAAGQIYGLFGQPLFVSGWLEGLFCADDMYRLIPRTEIDGAFLFAFLRTPHGQVLIKRQACGNSIPRVWDPHIRKVRVPWPKESFRQDIASVIMQAHTDIEEARLLEQKSVSLVEKAIEEAS